MEGFVYRIYLTRREKKYERRREAAVLSKLTRFKWKPPPPLAPTCSCVVCRAPYHTVQAVCAHYATAHKGLRQ